jgi:hypothetical protein
LSKQESGAAQLITVMALAFIDGGSGKYREHMGLAADYSEIS